MSSIRLANLLQAARGAGAEEVNRVCEVLRPYVAEASRGMLSRALAGKVGESDLVQEAMLGVSQSIATFPGQTDGELLAFVRGIVQNKSLELHRRFLGVQKRDVAFEQAIDLGHSSQRAVPLAVDTPSPREKLSRIEELERIKALIKELPEHYQLVLELRLQQDLSFPEIAGRMGRTEPSVKNLYVRALTAIKQRLQHLDVESVLAQG